MRAYAPIVKRQQGADRLAYNEDDLRRILWQAVDPNFSGTRPATIRLGADIILTRPIKLYPGQYNVTIDGGRQFGFKEARNFVGNGLFEFDSVSTSDIAFIDTSFHVPTVQNLFLCSASTVIDDLSIENCNITGNTSTLFIFSVGLTLTDSKLHFDNLSLNVFFSSTPATFTGSLRFSYIEAIYNQSHPIITRTANGVSFGVEGPQLAVDIGGGMRMRPASVTLAGANPVLTVGDRSVFEITIDNATATGDMDMTAGEDGQIVVLYFINTATNMRLSDYGNIDVNKNHSSKHPLQDETVTFIWLSSKWREIARSENN
jgi:hypothetical protein